MTNLALILEQKEANYQRATHDIGRTPQSRNRRIGVVWSDDRLIRCMCNGRRQTDTPLPDRTASQLMVQLPKVCRRGRLSRPTGSPTEYFDTASILRLLTGELPYASPRYSIFTRTAMGSASIRLDPGAWRHRTLVATESLQA